MSMGSGGMFGDPGRMPVDVSQFTQLPQMKPKGGMFGGGDWKSALAAALAGFSAGGGNPAGQMALQMLHQRLGQKREDQQYERRQADQWNMWQRQQEYQQQHQGPDPLAQMMQQAGIDPASPQGRQMYQQALQNKVNPFVAVTRQNPDGSEVREFMRPPQVPTAPVGGLTPIDDEEGGPRPLGVGGFPGSF
jgi:hypothetical protein